MLTRGYIGAVTESDIAPEVRRFILTSVPSVPYLEALLLLRAQPDTYWSAAQVARRLYLSDKRAEELLGALVANGVAQQEAPGYRYHPISPELAELLDQVAATYTSRLVEVTDLIHSRVDKRAQQFADAFRWRKDSK